MGIGVMDIFTEPPFESLRMHLDKVIEGTELMRETIIAYCDEDFEKAEKLAVEVQTKTGQIAKTKFERKGKEEEERKFEEVVPKPTVDLMGEKERLVFRPYYEQTTFAPPIQEEKIAQELETPQSTILEPIIPPEKPIETPKTFIPGIGLP